MLGDSGMRAREGGGGFIQREGRPSEFQFEYKETKRMRRSQGYLREGSASKGLGPTLVLPPLSRQPTSQARQCFGRAPDIGHCPQVRW